MKANDPELQQTGNYRFRTSRRSWLAAVAAGIAALSSFSARAHEPESGTRPKARSFADLRKVQAANLVKTIDYNSGAYRVWTADGKYSDFAVADLRFAIDPSVLGPVSGRPALWPSGHGRDRALVFFATPHEITAFVKVPS